MELLMHNQGNSGGAALLLLSFLAVVPGISFAQTAVDAPTASPASSPTLSTQTFSGPIPSLSPTTSLLSSHTTSFTTSLTPNTTTSSVTSRVTNAPIPPPLFEPAGHPADSSDPATQQESVFNYYFLILAAFGVLVAIGLWWIRQRRKRRKEQMRLSGQDALARDLDGWVNTRRWIHGAWRHNQSAAFVRREEGLNEHGEAPPPYQPKNEVAVAPGSPGAAEDPASGLTIPLRTLSREPNDAVRPPEYRETDVQHGPSGVRPNTATSRVSRTGSLGDHPNTSTRDLLQAGSSPSNG